MQRRAQLAVLKRSKPVCLRAPCKDAFCNRNWCRCCPSAVFTPKAPGSSRWLHNYSVLLFEAFLCVLSARFLSRRCTLPPISRLQWSILTRLSAPVLLGTPSLPDERQRSPLLVNLRAQRGNKLRTFNWKKQFQATCDRARPEGWHERDECCRWQQRQWLHLTDTGIDTGTKLRSSWLHLRRAVISYEISTLQSPSWQHCRATRIEAEFPQGSRLSRLEGSHSIRLWQSQEGQRRGLTWKVLVCKGRNRTYNY